MKLTNINEARRIKRQHVASIAGKDYTDITFRKAKMIAHSLGADILWWDNVPYIFADGMWNLK